MRTFFFDHHGIKVRVYRNLNKAGPNFGCWSIKSVNSLNYGRVILHASDVILQGARPVISEPGRQRVIKEGRKNVHAYLEGYLIAATVLEERYETPAEMKVLSNGPLCPGVEQGEIEITYNPYKCGSFYEKQTGFLLGDSRHEIHLNQDHSVSIVPHLQAVAA